MGKTLSIIIPTYNMEALLPRCLDSLVAAKNREKMDVIVVNDGSKDGSLEVMKSYAEKYPEVVRYIDKANGNYGSTINVALPTAKGKYVRILDSDDRYDTKALDIYIDKLKETNSDLVYTPFVEIGEGGKREVVKYNTMGREPYEYGREYDAEKVMGDGYVRYFLMHGIAWKRTLLEEVGYRQTEGVSYTDTEWDNYPTYAMRTVTFLPEVVYEYNVAREGQTMAQNVMEKSVRQMDVVFTNLLNHYEEKREELSETRNIWMKKYLENRISFLYRLMLIKTPRKTFDAETMKNIDEKYSTLCQKLGLVPEVRAENRIIRTEYISYWRRHKNRPSVWLEIVSGILDKWVRWIYVRTVRR